MILRKKMLEKRNKLIHQIIAMINKNYDLRAGLIITLLEKIK